MSGPGICPRCETSLTPGSELAEELSCRTCQGVFVPAKEIHQSLLESGQTTPPSDKTAESTTNIICPGCGESMAPLWLGELELDRCNACKGVWLDGGEMLPDGTPADPMSMITQYFVYGLTLPERTVRSAVGLTAGTATELAGFLVPQAFQSSKTYEIVVRNSLKFLTEDIGGVESKQEDGSSPELGDDYLARKAVGNFLDWTSFLTLHISPMWILAVVSDVAYGSKAYIQELAKELQAHGIIDEQSTIHNVDDILDAIQRASGESASLFDAPPINIDQLKKSLASTKEALESADLTTLLPQSEVKRFWNDMHDIAKRDKVGMLEVSGAMTLHTLDKIKSVSIGALTGVSVAGGLFNKHVIGHYVSSLQSIQKQGLFQTVMDCHAPYVEGVWKNYASDHETWTEQIVTGKLFASAYQKVRGWLFGKKDEGKG